MKAPTEVGSIPALCFHGNKNDSLAATVDISQLNVCWLFGT